jgi:hypothetical protein
MKRIYKRKREERRVSKRIKRLLISYSKYILGWAGDNQPGKRKERREQEKREEQVKERPKERKGLKECTGPKFGKNQTIPSQRRYWFRWAIYNTIYQFLTRVKNITYLRVSWGIAGLTLVQRRKEKKKKSRSDYLYKVSNNFFSYVLFISVDYIYFILKIIKLILCIIKCCLFK